MTHEFEQRLWDELAIMRENLKRMADALEKQQTAYETKVVKGAAITKEDLHGEIEPPETKTDKRCGEVKTKGDFDFLNDSAYQCHKAEEAAKLQHK